MIPLKLFMKPNYFYLRLGESKLKNGYYGNLTGLTEKIFRSALLRQVHLSAANIMQFSCSCLRLEFALTKIAGDRLPSFCEEQ
jgi:hypothetical protein